MVTHPTSTPLTPIVVNRQGLIALGITLTNSALLKLERQGLFPRRFRMAGSIVSFWRYDDVVQHVANAAAAPPGNDLAAERAARATAGRQTRRAAAR